MAYYGTSRGFSFLAASSDPAWRLAQRGAIGALIGHWSMPRQPPALISLPTGSGKTAVAVAAPHLIAPERVLVVVPTQELRRQTASAFEKQAVLRRIGALKGRKNPLVVEVTGMVDQWSDLRRADVVVALPNSISPVHYDESDRPPRDLFDLIIVDEAHHSPARTWRAILDHFDEADSVLLTATPRRRDGQQLPGVELFHYPVRLALEHGFYKPVQPRIVDLPPTPSRELVDRAIAQEAVAIAMAPEHATSSLLIRARTRERAQVLGELYAELGLDVSTLFSGMPRRGHETVLERVRSGDCRAVAVVNMLGEGFDLPKLRIAAYHDKHRSLTATTQFLGRLARADLDYPQPSVVVVARDIDVHPQLVGAVRALYEEDADWAQVLPGLIDDQIEEQRADRAFVSGFATPPPTLALEAITPGCSVVIHEVSTEAGYEPGFVEGTVPEGLQEGRRLTGQTVLYSGISPTGATLLVVTTEVTRPRWHASNPGLDAPTYDLHLLTWRRSPRLGEPHLLLANSRDGSIANSLLRAVGAEDAVRTADPRRLQDAFDALDRVSVSSVGVRNTYRGSSVGVPSYTMFAGSGVDRGLRDTDTGRRALGHAIAQIGSGKGSYSAGVATGKSKYWEARSLSLRNYEVFATGLAARYWAPTVSAAGRLLPNVTRGERLERFPGAPVVVIELSPILRGMGWVTAGGQLVEELELQVDPAQARTDFELPLIAFDPRDPAVPVWRGYQDIFGRFHCKDTELEVHLGYGTAISLESLLADQPPSVFFLDGQTVIGAVGYRSMGRPTTLPDLDYKSLDWGDVDITIETKQTVAKKSAAGKKVSGISINEKLENYLKAMPQTTQRRWILCNDGKGEIADYIVIEMNPGRQVTVSLWHAKASSNAKPGVRVKDLQTVAQQAIKSRGYITDPGFWRLLGGRLAGRETPKVTMVEGSRRLLLLLCGENSDHLAWSLAHRPPILAGRIAVAQPGLSMNELRTQLKDNQPSIASVQIREFLTVLHDAVSQVADVVLLSSD